MGFWKNVDKELEFSGKTRKELAAEVNFPDSYISKGISRNSIPSADLALKIAHALNVPLESLLELQNDSSPTQEASQQNQLRLYRKYQHIITSLESFTPEKQELVKNLIQGLERI